MSFTATISIVGSPSAARKMLRPMRPKPLMPTLIAMNPPQMMVRREPHGRNKTIFRNGDARMCAAKSQRATGTNCEACGDISAIPSVKFLYTNNLVAGERHEGRARRWSPVNPVLGFRSVGIALAHFVLRTSQRRQHHFVIHPH